MGKFNKGLFLGGLFGGLVTWMNTTKKGKAVRDDLLQHATKAYELAVTEIKGTDKWQDLQEHEYVAKVRELVNRYAIENGLSDKVKGTLSTLLEKQWTRFKSGK